MKNSFQQIWNRIVERTGDTFHTKTDKQFSFETDRDYFLPSRTHYQKSRSDFERAYADVPFDGPGAINWVVRDSSYIWGVLHDPRIRL